MTTLTAAQVAEQAAKLAARIDLLWCQAHVPASTQSWEVSNFCNIWTCRECGAKATHKTMVSRPAVPPMTPARAVLLWALGFLAFDRTYPPGIGGITDPRTPAEVLLAGVITPADFLGYLKH
jgi:hypothetical protein